MMRKNSIFLARSVVGAPLMAALLGLVGAPVSAQTDTSSEAAFTPEDDLDCAIYVGALMAESEAEMTPESRTGLTSAFTYFTGRYEAVRGIALVEAFSARYPIYQQRNPTEIAQTCSVRMRAFGARLQRAGRALSELQPAAPTESSSPEGR